MECALLSEERPIKKLIRQTATGEEYLVLGESGVTSIIVIPVAGQSGYVPWFEVTQHDIVRRWNSAHLSGIEYVLTIS